MDPIPAMDEGALECENCGSRPFLTRTGIGTFCPNCLSRLLDPEVWPFDDVRWSVIVDAWRERLA